MAGVLLFLPGLLHSLLALFNDATTRRDRPPNKSSIPDPRIEQTDDQALDRPRVIYIGNKRAQKAGVFHFLPGLLQSLLALFNDVATRRDRPPNEPSIPDPRIEQTNDQALGRYIHLGAIYIGNKIELSS